MFRAFSILALVAAVSSVSGCDCVPSFQGIWCTPDPSEQVTPHNTPSGSEENSSGSRGSTSSYPSGS